MSLASKSGNTRGSSTGAVHSRPGSYASGPKDVSRCNVCVAVSMALLVFLTSLDDPVLAESFVRDLDLICRQHLILVNMLQPPGVRPLFSDGIVASLDEVYKHLGGHLLWHKLCELERVLQRRGVRFSLLDNERLSAQLVTQYLNVKQRQLI